MSQKIPDKAPIKTCENSNQQKNSYKENKKDIYDTQLKVLINEKEDSIVRIAAINAIYESDFRTDIAFQRILQNISISLSDKREVKVVALKTLSKI